MRKVIVDMRSNAASEDVSERCRLSGTPLVVVASRERKAEERMLGARWDVLRGRACEGFSLRHVHVVDASREVAAAVAREVGDGDVVVTCDALVAAMAADAGALALDDHGREHDDPWEFVSRRERMREEGTLLAYYESHKPRHVTGADVSRLYDAVAARIPGILESPRVASLAGARIVVDADNMPVRPALAAARSHDIEAVLVHDASGPLKSGVLPSDPVEGARGFRVSEVVVPPGKDAADRAIERMAGSGDVVATNDSELTLACVRAGASVVDGLGAIFLPDDAGRIGEIGVTAVRRRRWANRRHRSGDVGAGILVIDGAESLLGRVPARRARRPAAVPANPTYISTTITLVTTRITR